MCLPSLVLKKKRFKALRHIKRFLVCFLRFRMSPSWLNIQSFNICNQGTDYVCNAYKKKLILFKFYELQPLAQINPVRQQCAIIAHSRAMEKTAEAVGYILSINTSFSSDIIRAQIMCTFLKFAWTRSCLTLFQCLQTLKREQENLFFVVYLSEPLAQIYRNRLKFCLWIF